MPKISWFKKFSKQMRWFQKRIATFAKQIQNDLLMGKE
jgi:hypothetical protein